MVSAGGITVIESNEHFDSSRAQSRAGDVGRVAAENCYLAGVRLLAVQPACLQAHPDTPAQPQQGLGDGFSAVGPPRHEHDVLLHMEAALLYQGPTAAQFSAEPGQLWSFDTLAEVPAGKSANNAAPVPLQHANLEVVVVSRCMQLIQQQQYSLLELVLQQQDQQQHQLRVVRGSSSLAGKQRCSSSVLQSGVDSSSLEHVQPCSIHTDCSQMLESSDELPGKPCSWTVLLNLHISFPCWPTDRLLDSLHLVLLVRTMTALQEQQHHISLDSVSSVAGDSSGPMQPRPKLVAEVPLLVLPAAAQQEVQQLLLPAMRQEVQAEQQHQQQQQQLQGTQPTTAAEISASYMQMETAVWRHYSQLANDIHTVLQLISAAAAAPSPAEADDLAPGTPLLHTAAEPTSPTITVVPLATAGASEAVVPAAPAAALIEVTQTLLFPLLLPFIACQGLHNLLLLLVSCLPAELQQQWQLQQVDRLGRLAQVAPAPLQLPVDDDLAGPAATAPQEAAAASAASAADTAGKAAESEATSGTQSQMHLREPVTAADRSPMKPEAPSSSISSSATLVQQQDGTSSSEGLRQRSTAKPAAAKPAAAAGDDLSFAAVRTEDVTCVPWYMPLAQFAPSTEQRYVEWKHNSLLNLDYLGALFAVMYVAVLLRKLMREPATLFYLCYIMIKTLPHVPLILGYRQAFLRYREHWLFLVAPACLLLTWAFSMHSIAQGQPAMLLPNRAYKAYWSGHGHLATSAMRPFTQHMRLRKYILYCLLDGAISAWAFGQVFGVWVAARRWLVAVFMSVVLAWGFDLYMRRRFMSDERQRMQLQRVQQERLQQKQQQL